MPRRVLDLKDFPENRNGFQIRMGCGMTYATKQLGYWGNLNKLRHMMLLGLRKVGRCGKIRNILFGGEK
jgi:hypothetical protein